MSLWMIAWRWMPASALAMRMATSRKRSQRRPLVAKHRVERDVAEVLEHQRDAVSVFDEAERADDLGQVERREHRVLVAEARNLCAGSGAPPEAA